MADDRMKVSHQQASLVFSDLIESLIVDIATEAHRAARLGFDYKLNVEEEEEVRLAAHARAVVGDSGATGTEIGNKHTIDVFGQTHPTIASEMFECMNCGRPIVAGRFAPHLEKCMGKGRKARIKASRNLSMNQQRRVRSTPISAYGATGSGTPTAGRTPPNRTPNRTLEDIHRDLPADTSNANNDGGESEESHDDDEKDLSYGVPRPGKARSRKTSGVWTGRANLTQISTSSGGLVPVPLQVSPVRPSCAASVAGLSEGAPVGSAAGLTVEVAVEQFNSFVSGRVPPSCNIAPPKKGTKPQASGGGGQGHVKIRRAGEKTKKKNLGQVLAGSSPVTKCGEPGTYGDMNVTQGQGHRVANGADGLVERERTLQNGSSGKGVSDSSSDLYSNGGDRTYHREDLSVEPSSTTGSAGDGGKRPAAVMALTGGGRVGNGKGKSHARLGLGLGGGAGMRRTRPQGAGDGDDPRAGNEEMTDFGKKKKRLRAASKPTKQGQQSPVPVSASGGGNWVTIIELFDDEDRIAYLRRLS